jgi:hypothetical protein
VDVGEGVTAREDVAGVVGPLDVHEYKVTATTETANAVRISDVR